MELIQKRIFSVILISCLGLIVYSNTFHASFQFDDKPSITDNYAIKHLDNIPEIFNSWPCRFLTYLSLAINYHFQQLDVLGYHLFNIIVHLGSAVLLWWFVLLTLSTPVMKGNKIAPFADEIALFSALVFVSHPVQTEAVTYIVQRASSLAGLFYLASLCLYVKARLLQEGNPNSRLGRQIYILALITTVLTMFTKEMVITLPVMMLLYEAFFFKTKKGLNWKALMPFLLTIIVIPATMVATKYIDFHGMRRAVEGPQGITPIEYLLTQFRVLVTYIRLDFLPLNQNLDYEYAVSKSIFDLATFSSLLILTGILYSAQRLFLNYRLLSFSILWFFLTLLPESSVIPIRDVIFEHRLYLPLAGYCIFLVSGLFYLFPKRSFATTGMILTLIICINSFLTYERNKVWQDEFHLWDDIVHKSPHKERPVNTRGTIYDAQGQYDKAIADYDKAIELNPKFDAAYSNRGNVYNKEGNFTKALLDYGKALQLNPGLDVAYCNRGEIYFKEGDIGRAIQDYDKAISLDPMLGRAYFNRAACYVSLGKAPQAFSDFNKALEINPDNVEGFNNRANLYAQIGNWAQAILDYSQAIRLAPGLAVIYKNRGGVYYQQGNFIQALSDFDKAIQLKNNYVDGYFNRAATYYQLKEYDRAWEDLHTLEGLGSSDPALRRALERKTGRHL